MMIEAPNREVRIASLTGHVVVLRPGEQCELAEHLALLALQQGCRVAGMKPAEASDPGPGTTDEAPLEFGGTAGDRFAEVDPDGDTPEARREGIEAAIKELIERNDLATFTGTGQPRVRDVAALLGYAVSREEVEQVFSEMNGGD